MAESKVFVGKTAPSGRARVTYSLTIEDKVVISPYLLGNIFEARDHIVRELWTRGVNESPLFVQDKVIEIRDGIYVVVPAVSTYQGKNLEREVRNAF